jgi:parallel beta-helix repeat protein
MALVPLVTIVTSASDGSPVITVSSATGLTVGAKIIIISEHGYNEVGLGGVFPFTTTILNDYYFGTGMNFGRSFEATISAIAGTTLTLNANASAACVGKQLVVDSADDIEAKIEAGTSWDEFEGQTFYIGRTLQPFMDDSEQVIDFKNVEFKSPRGCYSATFIPTRTGGGKPSNKIWKNFRFTGNMRDSGYGPPEGALAYQSFPKSIVIGGSNNIIDNCTATDLWMSFYMEYAYDCVIQNSTVVRNDPIRRYIQWDALTSNTQRCVFHNVNYESDYPAAFYESYFSSGTVAYECHGRNGIFSQNTSGKCRIVDCSADWDWVSDGSPNATIASSPMAHIGRTQETQQNNGPVAGTEGGCFYLRFNCRIRNAPFSGSRILQHHVTGRGLHGIDTDSRIADGTYVCDIPDAHTGLTFFGYYMNGAVGDTAIEMLGSHTVTQLTGQTVNKWTMWDAGTNGYIARTLP